jgi:hypothetical protein
LQPNCRSRSFRVYFSRLPLANPNLHHTVSHLTSPTDDLPPLPLPRLDQDPTLRNSPTGANHAVILDRTRELDLALSLACTDSVCDLAPRTKGWLWCLRPQVRHIHLLAQSSGQGPAPRRCSAKAVDCPPRGL